MGQMGRILQLGDLQRTWRAQRRSSRRVELRQYLIERAAPSATVYQIVSRRLYADGSVDNLGLTDAWIETASERERGRLFSQIASDLLKV
jgi:hypothetical protein